MGLSRRLLLLPWLGLCLLGWARLVAGMKPGRMADLREQTGAMFYHGFDNYMRHAFPEDELRPVSCKPLSRDPQSTNIGLNDVLGNYSLTLIDSLSTLAILAGSLESGPYTGPRALGDFQHGVEELVRHYGDGRPGSSGHGIRSRGFDLDSKVQVFETVIRGVGGLLSAHLFAVGELPIAGYDATPRAAMANDSSGPLETPPIEWRGGFEYDGQLLRLALDLAERLLPAFYTKTGLPYPRVNLRHGIPFYLNSPLHGNVTRQNAVPKQSTEVTETCSAGAGSLVLEFTVLSRLTGDPRFEQAAKRAFWSVWDRRSHIGLIGNGIDAEEGTWIGVATGIGAGIDSFFEYALKSHILLSGHDQPGTGSGTSRPPPVLDGGRPWLDPNSLYPPLAPKRDSADAFLKAWHKAHAAIKRHLYTDSVHPHYVNGHISTGSPVTQWIDSLGAFYPGLLTLAGEVEEAIGAQLVYTALWTRYAALPERWSLRDGNIESGLGWWPGRPEFVESTYYLYRATKDPWHLYVGEMVLKDIKRRCWAECGWSGLEDVRTGEKSDRMESFFLGETAKYMYLLFDPDHPLNKLDAAFVFTTEGHPLIIPKSTAFSTSKLPRTRRGHHDSTFTNSCPAPPSPSPLTGSATAARADLFHAASLIGLHNTPNVHGPVEALSAQPASHITPARFRAKTNHTLFPWTLPPQMLPDDGTCAKITTHSMIRLEFPTNWGGKVPEPAVGSGVSDFLFRAARVVRAGRYGVEILDMAGMKMTLKLVEDDNGLDMSWRATMVANVPLGRDELVYVNADLLGGFSDELFNRVVDPSAVDLVLSLELPVDGNASTASLMPTRTLASGDMLTDLGFDSAHAKVSHYRSLLHSLVKAVTSAFDAEPTVAGALGGQVPTPEHAKQDSGAAPAPWALVHVQAGLATGPGAIKLPRMPNAPAAKAPLSDHGPLAAGVAASPMPKLQWSTVFLAGDACDDVLPHHATQHHVVVVRRGGCTFSTKLGNIPDFEPGPSMLQLVVVVDEGPGVAKGHDDDPRHHFHYDYDADYDTDDDVNTVIHQPLTQPLLEDQLLPSGEQRPFSIPMVLVHAGPGAYDRFAAAKGVGVRAKYWVESQGVRVENVRLL